ncbi:DUF3306 domain-containing protein [Psychromarinibacter sp. S121]|uniref:DUF3306 domain-containing protein n=1 Tax=Psychromarinibacter sp. S121 TaxID=3415127 RepID=UPI003C7EA876
MSFWANRRAAVAAEEKADRLAAEAREVAAQEVADADKTDAELLAQFGLPDPSTMNAGDDFRAFMAREVPARLRRLALRKMWRTNPVLACVDGLNDYDGDFTNAATDAPGVKTAYQVGKGLTAHVEKLAREALGTDTPEPVAAAAEDETEEVAALTPEAAQPERTEQQQVQPQEAAAPEPEAVSLRPRRMRFAFDETATHGEQQTA